MSAEQPPLDLLPQSVRDRNRAATQGARSVATVLAAIVIVAVVSIHARITSSRAAESLQETRRRADVVLASEARAAELRSHMRSLDEFERRYRSIALPLEVSAVIATVVGQMPQGTTLDRIDLDAGARRQSRTARSRTEPPATPARSLTVELSGFAPSDEGIAEFVSRLKTQDAFRNVSLDFSRTRLVRERSAREFRLSFRIPLDEPIQVTWVDTEDPAP